jgi:superkiller protein 3
MELQAVPAADRRSVPVLLEQSAALLDAGEYGRALELLDRAAKADPDVSETHRKRGRALENLGPEHLEEAAAAYRVALSLDPGACRAREGLANVLDRLGDRANAEAQWEEVLRQASGRWDAEQDLLELAGRCFYRLDRVPEAVSAFERALAIDPAWVAVRFDLGLVQLVSGARLEAVASYARALGDVAAVPSALGSAQAALDELVAVCEGDPALRVDAVTREIVDALAGAVGAADGLG